MMAMPSFARSTCRILPQRSVCSPPCSVIASPCCMFLPSQATALNGFIVIAMQSIIELSRTQDEEVGDGTTSVIILGPLCI